MTAIEKKTFAQGDELSDEELAAIAGGARVTMKYGKFYRYIGPELGPHAPSMSMDGARCPSCGKGVVHRCGMGVYSCDNCGMGWSDDPSMMPRFKNSLWKEITFDEFIEAVRSDRA